MKGEYKQMKTKLTKRLETLERQYKLESGIINSGHATQINQWIFDTIDNLPFELRNSWYAKFHELMRSQIENRIRQ